MKRKISDMTLYGVLRFLFLIGIIGLLVWYALFQSRLLIAGPQIEFNTQLKTVQTERVVTVEGTAQNVVTITLNGRDISVDESGSFNESLVLENGYTIMTIEAKDRYGRVARIERPFMYSSS